MKTWNLYGISLLFWVVALILTVPALAQADPNLVAYYPFSGDPCDASGNGHHGTVYGATLCEDRFCEPNSAYSFDGVANYIDIPNSSELEYSSMTICAWVRNFRETASPERAAVSKNQSGIGGGFILGMGTSENAFYFYVGGSHNLASATYDSNWHFIVGVLDDGISTIYVDGIPENSRALTLWPSPKNVQIGRIFAGDGINGTHYWDGAIDEVRIYNRALSAEEIRILAEQPPDDYEFVTEWGEQGSGDGQFSVPDGIAVDNLGYIYVSDYYNSRVQKFTSDGTYITQWGSPGSGDGQFSRTNGIATDPSGCYVFVSDEGNHRIQKFTCDGVYITQWGTFGNGDGQFNNPVHIAVDLSGKVFVVDIFNCRIQKFTNNGTYITKWGSCGSGDGQFKDPYGIAVDSAGYVYVTDSGNKRIQKFTNDGTYDTKWGSSGTGDGQFAGPTGITIDSSGYTYVADSSNHRIQKFTSDGKYVAQWGSSGSGDGQFDHPYDVVEDSEGYVYVADSHNNRVQKFIMPVFELVSPNGGQELEAGSTKTIEWTGRPGAGIDFVQLEYSTDTCRNDWQTIDVEQASAGSYQWTVPADYSPNCLVRISALGYMLPMGAGAGAEGGSQPDVGDIWDTSNDVFTIYGCAHRLSADLSGPAGTPDCYVDIYDIAALAAQWLDCGYEPQAYCW